MKQIKLNFNDLRVGKTLIDSHEVKGTLFWKFSESLIQEYVDSGFDRVDEALEDLSRHLVIHYSGMSDTSSVRFIDRTQNVIDQLESEGYLDPDLHGLYYNLMILILEQLVIQVLQ